MNEDKGSWLPTIILIIYLIGGFWTFGYYYNKNYDQYSNQVVQSAIISALWPVTVPAMISVWLQSKEDLTSE